MKVANECFIADSIKGVQLDSLAGVVSDQAQEIIQVDAKTDRARWIGRLQAVSVITVVLFLKEIVSRTIHP